MKTISKDDAFAEIGINLLSRFLKNQDRWLKRIMDAGLWKPSLVIEEEAFTRRHFIGIARLLGSIEAEQDLAESFCEFFQAHNNAFDKAKFMWEIDDAWGKEWEMPK